MAQDQVSVEFLDRFASAFNRHDADAILNMMTEDAVFEASAGPEVKGQVAKGREAVRRDFRDVFETFPDAQWCGARHFVAGDRGVSEWVFSGTRVDGARVEVQGCDIFTIRDGKIAVKNSCRKQRT